MLALTSVQNTNKNNLGRYNNAVSKLTFSVLTSFLKQQQNRQKINNFNKKVVKNKMYVINLCCFDKFSLSRLHNTAQLV